MKIPNFYRKTFKEKQIEDTIDSLAWANPDYYLVGRTHGQHETSALNLYAFSVYIINSGDKTKIILLYSHLSFASFFLGVISL